MQCHVICKAVDIYTNETGAVNIKLNKRRKIVFFVKKLRKCFVQVHVNKCTLKLELIKINYEEKT